MTYRLLNFHTLWCNDGMLISYVFTSVGLRVSWSILLTADGALQILMQLAWFAVLMDLLLEQYSKLTCYSHLSVMACKMKDGHCVIHMSTTWIVLQTIHERSTKVNKMFPRVMIDNTKRFSSYISRWNLLYMRDLTVIDLSYLSFTHVECHIWQGYCWLIHYLLLVTDNSGSVLRKLRFIFTYLISPYTLCPF